MPRKTDLEKVTIRLRRGDFGRLGELFSRKGITANEAIRLIVSTYVDKADAEAEATDVSRIQMKGVEV